MRQAQSAANSWSMQDLVVTIVCAAFLLLFPTFAQAQAWTPPKGEGSVSIAYQNIYVRDHLDRNGNKLDRGRIHTNTMLVSIDAGITDRIALSGDVIYVASRYDGSNRDHGAIDDGAYHPTFQDASVAVRYNLLTSPLIVTPFIGGVAPTHSYGTLGHSAVGRRLLEMQLGVNVARDLGPLLENAYVHAHYSYAIVQRLAGMNLNRSKTDLEFGYSVTSRLGLRALGAWQHTYGGFEVPLPRDEHFAENFLIHDRAARANFFRAGGGATFSVRRSVDVFADFVTTISGQNHHAIRRGIVVGTSWDFGGGFASARGGAQASRKDSQTQ